ncbi:hypothetical protein ACAG24_024195 [Mycobacterium sp. pW049]|uniref:hypothetical protein n=1 Tax=[Mycobacterium] bulgaricum TaxID=3238985 RepID=UPI00351B8451
MLVHARAEILALAQKCTLTDLGSYDGWEATLWRLDDDDVALAIEAYRALLNAGMDDMTALLLEDGIDLDELLTGGTARDEITRSDVTELIAAASMITGDGCHVDRMHMPNVPKMARGKSDSGIDVLDIRLDPEGSFDQLGDDERLVIGSVKHTVGDSTSQMRYALAKTLGSKELSTGYLARQLRTVHHRLVEQGLDRVRANRLMLFVRDFYKNSAVRLVAVGCADPSMEDDLRGQLNNLPSVPNRPNGFRIVTVPDISSVHEDCP